MDNKTYHGWVFVEKEPGFKDAISTHDREDRTINWGRGERAAAKAVEHFEITLGLGPVKLLPTPLGLRVYTEEVANALFDVDELIKDYIAGNKNCNVKEDTIRHNVAVIRDFFNTTVAHRTRKAKYKETEK